MQTLTEYLKTNGETQVQFAQRIGVHQGTISKLTTGSLPSWKLAADIEAATDGAVPVTVWSHIAKRGDPAAPIQGERKGDAA